MVNISCKLNELHTFCDGARARARVRVSWILILKVLLAFWQFSYFNFNIVLILKYSLSAVMKTHQKPPDFNKNKKVFLNAINPLELYIIFITHSIWSTNVLENRTWYCLDVLADLSNHNITLFKIGLHFSRGLLALNYEW